MKVLVIGCKGQVGTELTRQADSRGYDVVPIDLPDIDITRKDSLASFLRTPGLWLVINAAAYTAVDKAESDPKTAFAANAEGPGLLADLCREKKIPLIHISTDYVFDGTQQTPYRETDPVCPIGVYGKSKAEGDRKIQEVLVQHIILRTAWVCSSHGANFVKTMLRLGGERETLQIVDDQTGCPTFAADIAEAIWDITDQYQSGKVIPWGIYNYCGNGSADWYEFAQEIFKQARAYQDFKLKALTPIPTEAYPTPAKRPKYSVLDCRKITRTFGIHPKPWQESLGRTLQMIYQS